MTEERAEYVFAKSTPWGIHFQGDDGEVGRLEFDEHGEITFSGNADAAARIFFDTVIKNNSQALTDERSLAKMGYEVVKDFLPNVGQCALQDYGRLNDFMIMATKEFGE